MPTSPVRHEQARRPRTSAVVLEALRASATLTGSSCLQLVGAATPLEPAWLSQVSALAEEDPLSARAFANTAVARAAIGLEDADLSLAVPAPRVYGSGGSGKKSSWVSVQPAGADETVGICYGPTGDLCIWTPEATPADDADVWHLSAPDARVRAAHARIPPRVIWVALRAVDDAVATGLLRSACRSAVEDARSQSQPGWSAELREAAAAELCLEYEAAVAMSLGTASLAPTLTAPVLTLVSCLSRYWIGRSVRRVASRGGTATGQFWPDLDPSAFRLMRHAMACAASGGSPEQILADVNETLVHHPSVLDGMFEVIQTVSGRDRLLDEHIRRLRQHLLRNDGRIQASSHVIREIALVLQAAFVAATCPAPVEDAFLRTRLGAEPLPHLAQGLPAALQSTLFARV